MGFSTTLINNNLGLTVMPLGNGMHQMRLMSLDGSASDAVSRDLTEYEVHLLLAYYHTAGTMFGTDSRLKAIWQQIFPQDDWRHIGE